MSTLEVRRAPGGPWELLHDVYPGIRDDVGPSIGGPPDERVFMVWAMQTGLVTFVPTIDPQCPLAFRLSGQFRDRGGWQIMPSGIARMARNPPPPPPTAAMRAHAGGEHYFAEHPGTVWRVRSMAAGEFEDEGHDHAPRATHVVILADRAHSGWVGKPLGLPADATDVEAHAAGLAAILSLMATAK